jgi:hypothetical protein
MHMGASLGFGLENVSQELDLNMAIKFGFMSRALHPTDKGTKILTHW